MTYARLKIFRYVHGLIPSFKHLKIIFQTIYIWKYKKTVEMQVRDFIVVKFVLRAS